MSENAKNDMKIFHQISAIIQSEIRFLFMRPRKLVSAALLAFVPAIYCVLYITSVWAPESKTRALSVAVVNLDKGVQYKNRTVNLGWEITTRLEDSGRFGFVISDDEQNARALVRQGKLAFAVIIPGDFSATAASGTEAGAAKVMVYTSQGNNFQTAAIAKHFAESLGHEINERLNERRWVLVLHNDASMQNKTDLLHQVVGKLRSSVRQLGSDSTYTTTGLQTVADELATHETLTGANHADLVRATQLNQRHVAQIASGIELLAKTFPGEVDGLTGSADGLASSVAPVLEIDAPVENSGSGFSSNIVPGALWLGATMAAILIHVGVLPRHARLFSSPVQVTGKIFLPACVAIFQSLVVFFTVKYVLNIHILDAPAFALTLAISSLSFLFIVFAMIKAFGDAGEAMAMFLLAVQLSSSGGILPVELSGGLFAQISPWLPLTWVVESVKASMFGAYGGAWQWPLLLIVAAGIVGFVLSCTVGHWRFVKSTLPQAVKEK